MTAVLQPLGAEWKYLAGTAFVCGFLGGWAWQWLNPRDFVDRFGGWATLFGFASLLLFVPGSRRRVLWLVIARGHHGSVDAAPKAPVHVADRIAASGPTGSGRLGMSHIVPHPCGPWWNHL